MKKSGKQVHGAGWYKDPLGPPFHVNLFYAQRFIQISAAVPDPRNPKRSCMIPVAVRLIPKLPKPAKGASAQAWKDYEALKALNRPGVHALELLRRVRAHMDRSQQAACMLWVCGDGGYSNATVLKDLPPRARYIGRTRRDINLQRPATTPVRRGVGRPRAYDGKLATPQQLHQDRSLPWQRTEILNGATATQVRYKCLAPVRWHAAGETAIVQIIVIAPLRYRKRKQGPWHYTQPAYLICTEVGLSAFQLIQAYFWRWGIEVNFKEEKQLFGAGHAQVRGPSSVATAPVVAIAAYAALLLAGLQVYGFEGLPDSIRPPKWYRRKPAARVTASALIQQVRADLLLKAIRDFSPLRTRRSSDTTPEKFPRSDAA